MRERDAVVLIGSRHFCQQYSLERVDASSSTSSRSREPSSKGPQCPDSTFDRAGDHSADRRLSLRETEGHAVRRARTALARVDVRLAGISCGDATKPCPLQAVILVVACRRCAEQVRGCRGTLACVRGGYVVINSVCVQYTLLYNVLPTSLVRTSRPSRI